jgi:hypothetical protein
VLRRLCFTLLMLLLLAVSVLNCGASPANMAPGPGGVSRSGGMAEGEAFGGVADDADAAPPADMRLAQAEAPPTPTTTPAKPKPPPASSDTKEPVQTRAPLLIYTANYTLAVYEVTQSIDKVQALAKKLGGYLVRRADRAITIRVPAEKYAGALDDITKLGDVLHRQETVEDVTEKFFDLKTRLDNAKAMRVRLQELLAAAKDVKDALAVERELSRVTETIERLEGKLKRLRELINFSTITVQFSSHQSENVASKVNLPFPWLNQLGLGPLLQLR